MRELRIIRKAEEESAKKRKLPVPLIVTMGFIVFLALVFVSGKKEGEKKESSVDVSSSTGGSGNEKAASSPGKIKISPEKTSNPIPEKPKKKARIPKNELTFLKTLKGKKAGNAPFLGKKEAPKKAMANKPDRSGGKTDLTASNLSGSRRFSIQVASFSEEEGAASLAERLKKKGYASYVTSQELPKKGKWFRVRIGHYTSRDDAKKAANQIRKAEKFDPLIITQ